MTSKIEADFLKQELKELKAAPPPPRPEPPAPPKPSGWRTYGLHTISVTEKWPFTLRVKKGRKVRITATGKWRVRPGGVWHGPDDPTFYLQGRFEKGKPFKIGSEFTLQGTQDGILYLGMKEGGTYTNNSGEIKVLIEAEVPPGEKPRVESPAVPLGLPPE